MSVFRISIPIKLASKTISIFSLTEIYSNRYSVMIEHGLIINSRKLAYNKDENDSV